MHWIFGGFWLILIDFAWGNRRELKETKRNWVYIHRWENDWTSKLNQIIVGARSPLQFATHFTGILLSHLLEVSADNGAHVDHKWVSIYFVLTTLLCVVMCPVLCSHLAARFDVVSELFGVGLGSFRQRDTREASMSAECETEMCGQTILLAWLLHLASVADGWHLNLFRVDLLHVGSQLKTSCDSNSDKTGVLIHTLWGDMWSDLNWTHLTGIGPDEWPAPFRWPGSSASSCILVIQHNRNWPLHQLLVC